MHVTCLILSWSAVPTHIMLTRIFLCPYFASHASRKSMEVASVPTAGISKVTDVDFEYAKTLKSTIKLIGTASLNADGSLAVFVSPTMVYNYPAIVLWRQCAALLAVIAVIISSLYLSASLDINTHFKLRIIRLNLFRLFSPICDLSPILLTSPLTLTEVASINFSNTICRFPFCPTSASSCPSGSHILSFGCCEGTRQCRRGQHEKHGNISFQWAR